VHRLLAVQGQDPRGLRLAVRARSRGLTAAAVDAALSADRSLVVTWLNRGTLHLVTRDDYWWLHRLTTPPLATGNARRLAQEGVPPSDAARAVAVVERALTDAGPQTRHQLRDRIAAAGIRTQGQALVHVLALAALRGITVRGPMIEGEQAYVLVRDWLGAPPPAADRSVDVAELARRYLAGHGPAADRDLARWAGLPLRDARHGLAGIADELVQRPDGLVDLRSRPEGERDPARVPPKLLGAFDPLLLGWTSRDPVLGAHRNLVTKNGVFRPFALVGGRAVATWRFADGRVTVEPFDRLSPAVTHALDADAADVVRFLGGAG